MKEKKSCQFITPHKASQMPTWWTASAPGPGRQPDRSRLVAMWRQEGVEVRGRSAKRSARLSSEAENRNGRDRGPGRTSTTRRRQQSGCAWRKPLDREDHKVMKCQHKPTVGDGVRGHMETGLLYRSGAHSGGKSRRRRRGDDLKSVADAYSRGPAAGSRPTATRPMQC